MSCLYLESLSEAYLLSPAYLRATELESDEDSDMGLLLEAKHLKGKGAVLIGKPTAQPKCSRADDNTVSVLIFDHHVAVD